MERCGATEGTQSGVDSILMYFAVLFVGGATLSADILYICFNGFKNSNW